MKDFLQGDLPIFNVSFELRSQKKTEKVKMQSMRQNIDSVTVRKKPNFDVGKWLTILHNEVHWLVPI